jgi:hypothetical protein
MIYFDSFMSFQLINAHSNMTSFFHFVDKWVIYRWYNLIRTCTGECDWLFHWQHKLCATFPANINYRLPIICQPMFSKCKTHSGFHDLFRFFYVFSTLKSTNTVHCSILWLEDGLKKKEGKFTDLKVCLYSFVVQKIWYTKTPI